MFNRNKRSDNRSGTESWFKTRFTKTEAPSAPGPNNVETIIKPAPSYEHADRQTGPQDKEAESREHEDEEIRKDKGKNAEDKEQPVVKFSPSENKVTGNERHTGPSTSSASKAPQSFNRFWKLELEYDLEEEIEPETNYWTPNSFALFEVLRASGKYVYDNATVLKRHVDYLDYAVACYYSILFYIQILRAQKAAAKLRGLDRSFINRFKDKFPFEELPVSSIMEPFFSTLVATLPKDGKYDWIVPDYNNDIFRRDYSAVFAPGNGACFIQPMVPYMLRILRTAVTSARVTAAQANQGHYFNDDDLYVSRTLEAANAHALFGQNYQQNHLENNDRNTLLSCAGVSYPFYANLDQLSAAAPKMRKSKFRNFSFGVEADAGVVPPIIIDNNRPATALDNGHLDEFLHMEKTADTDWFYELIRQAALHARFFDGITNLSNIPVTSGNEPLISCRFKKIGQAVPYPDTRLGLRPAQAGVPEWYPDHFRGYLGSFYTTREGTERQEVLQAFTNGTNGTINVIYQNNDRIGEADVYRRGPYWRNKEWAATKFADTGNNVGKPMFRGWETMFQDDAALEKPVGY